MNVFNFKKLRITLIATLIVISSFASVTPTVFAATGGGTATIAVDGGAQGAGVSVVQSTSHTFTTVLTIPGAGMTLGAASPTFTIPTGFTAPTTQAVANAGLVVADGMWSVVASGGTCTVDSSPVSSTTVASGQVITVDITADCASGNTITLTYQGTSAITMGATQLVVSTADAGDPGPVTALIAGSPTITVTAASATATPTPIPSPTSGLTSTPTITSAPTANSSSSSGSGSSSGSTGSSAFCIGPDSTLMPIIVESKRVSPTSIFIRWNAFGEINMFNVQYGLTSGNWLYNTDVTGYSTTINSLPANNPIWVQVAARNSCSIGIYGESKLVGPPSLPDTGFAGHHNNPWYSIWSSLIRLITF